MAGALFTRLKVWGTEVLNKADLNAEFDNILNNFMPSKMDDASDNETAMQTTADPYPGGVTSLPTSLEGELRRLRYVLKQITGEEQWYYDATGKTFLPRAAAGGTADAITADFTPDITLSDKMIVAVVASAANATTTPTFAPDGLTAHAITKNGGTALKVGNISGAGHVLILEYNLANTRWELLNPSPTFSPSAIITEGLEAGESISSDQLRDAHITGNLLSSISASVGSDNLTVGINPDVLDFRSATLTTGAPNTRIIPTAISLVVPSTATLGTINAVAARLVILAIDNAGTVEVAIANLAGGHDLSESGLISTTAISDAADAANVVYSSSARTNVPYRIMGFIDITEATAGTWATAPSLVQPFGRGLPIIISQSPQDVTSVRAKATTYYNTSGINRYVSIIGHMGGPDEEAYLTINGVETARQAAVSASGKLTVGGFVPPGNPYRVDQNGTLTINKWTET